MKCSDISSRQQQLLFQCYCKTVYNTNFYKYVAEENKLTCTRNDKDNYFADTEEVCANYDQYTNCPGVALVALALSSLLFM
ncbi:hypothetical protein BX661DRAFT_225036 [Kickxella alabastrina]|uniref:uncharacterized protein n=1 Tax=Kickxella alabastrina TaxID=61397 RepID=UPI00221E7F90|nr:uncharacterized protein BX661DRAFT_225036 [Kickxella alabastrina]KAI7826305.1 hypothetical protein BX661DRAFT_225036 [Kickxella alabastrina]